MATVKVSKILASSEMSDVVSAIKKLRSRFSYSDLYDDDHDWPLALVWSEGYNAKRILEILLDDHEYYDGYKDVLSASFGGWVLAPDRSDLRENLIVQAALFHMIEAEEEADIGTSPTLEEDIAARYIFLGQEFVVEVLNPLGGAARLIEAKTDVTLWRELAGLDRQIESVVRAVAYLHHAVDRLGKPGFVFEPSLNKAFWVFEELRKPSLHYPFKETYVSRSLLQSRWTSNRETLALLYAASTIRVEKETLLDIILKGFLLDSHHKRFFSHWVGRARYVVDHIFSRMRNKSIAVATTKILGEGESIRFRPAPLDPVEKEIIKSIFNRDNNDNTKIRSLNKHTEF